MIIYLLQSDKPNKKWAMFFPVSKKVIHFGGKGYRDFTLMNDKKSVHYLSNKKQRDLVKDRYRARHAKDDIDNPETAGALSWFILWQMPTLQGGMKNYAKKFNLRVVDKTDETYSKEAISKLI
jgi:hypothetical protein